MLPTAGEDQARTAEPSLFRNWVAACDRYDGPSEEQFFVDVAGEDADLQTLWVDGFTYKTKFAFCPRLCSLKTFSGTLS
jgi:hypothetical protein